MVTPEETLSTGGQHALQDMVELQMYLLAQPQQRPWPMFSRGGTKLHEGKGPHCNPVEPSVAWELLELRFIEATSNRTFVVSRSGRQYYYERQKKQLLA
jgi:hypothetical protein